MFKKFGKLTREEDIERNGDNYCICGHDEVFQHRWASPKLCQKCSCGGYVFEVRR